MLNYDAIIALKATAATQARLGVARLATGQKKQMQTPCNKTTDLLHPVFLGKTYATKLAIAFCYTPQYSYTH